MILRAVAARTWWSATMFAVYRCTYPSMLARLRSGSRVYDSSRWRRSCSRRAGASPSRRLAARLGTAASPSLTTAGSSQSLHSSQSSHAITVPRISTAFSGGGITGVGAVGAAQPEAIRAMTRTLGHDREKQVVIAQLFGSTSSDSAGHSGEVAPPGHGLVGPVRTPLALSMDSGLTLTRKHWPSVRLFRPVVPPFIRLVGGMPG